MATIKKIGYGQVQPNHLSGIVTGQIYAQLPAHVKAGENDNVASITQLEQGQFAKYDYAAGEVNFTGDGEFMLVYNEEKLYDERFQRHKDFVFKTADFTDKKIYPRLIRTYVGDIITTNTFEAGTSNTAETTGVTIVEGNYMAPGTTGFLEVITSSGTAVTTLPSTGMVWKVVKITTMPDGISAGVKLQRVQ